MHFSNMREHSMTPMRKTKKRSEHWQIAAMNEMQSWKSLRQRFYRN
jgi:hypothetical protein